MTGYLVRRAGDQTDPGARLIFEAGRNLITGEDSFREYFGQPATSLEADVLLLAAAVFAADRASKRGEREDLARSIRLDLPVVNIERFLPLVPRIEAVLRTLSNDGWRVSFRRAPGMSEADSPWEPGDGATLLFSGGLDSLAAAIEFAPRENLQLVSHVTRNQQARAAQANLVEMLAPQRRLPLRHVQFFVSSTSEGPTPMDHAAENSQRTRSFLFLLLAALVARRVGHRRVLLIAENGQMAIHLPLSPARTGAFSTHTAHPDVLGLMEEIVRELLSTPIRIENPYVLRTKREVVAPVWSNLPEAIPVSVSCWRNTRLPAGRSHCGECVPCILRRVAIENLGPDTTSYAQDVLRQGLGLPAESEGRRNLVEIGAFILRMERLSNDEIMNEWPELYSPRIQAPDVIEMYRRFAGEARVVFGRYPSLRAVLQ